jgi:class 3 adenylate cyclase
LGHGTAAQSAADRVPVTILFADVVGSTRFVSEHGDAAWRDVAARFQDMLRAQVRRFRGRLIDTAGDGVFAVFDSPTRALECARAIREEAQILGLEVRIGVHAGESEISESGVRGLAVHIGARVLESAKPGEILVSRTVRDLVAGSQLAFAPRGRHRLKGVPGVWRLYALV